jgi:predicted small secreted protein
MPSEIVGAGGIVNVLGGGLPAALAPETKGSRVTEEKSDLRGWSVLALSVGAALATALAAAGCNTTEGAGEDLEAAGESIQEEADDAN